MSGGGGRGGGESGSLTQRFSTVGLGEGGATQQLSNFSNSQSTSYSSTTQQALSPGALQGGMTAAQYAQLQVEESQKRISQQMLLGGSGATAMGGGGAMIAGSGIGGSAGSHMMSTSVVPGDASYSTYSVETPGGGASYASSSSSDTKDLPGGFATTNMEKSSYSSYSSTSK